MNPIWLFGLLGLTVPVAIHLLSRKDTRVIRIGSLRHLEDSVTRQALSIRLNEILLLAVRCLIVGVAVMLLTDPFLERNAQDRKWLLIEPGLEQDAHWTSLVDSLKAQGFTVRQFATGFALKDFRPGATDTEVMDAATIHGDAAVPRAQDSGSSADAATTEDEATNRNKKNRMSDDVDPDKTGAVDQASIAEPNRGRVTGGLPDYWTLTEALSAQNLEQCVVISRSRMAGFTGRREAGASIIWFTSGPGKSAFTLTQKSLSPDSVVIRRGASDETTLSFETVKRPGIQGSAATPNQRSATTPNQGSATTPNQGSTATPNEGSTATPSREPAGSKPSAADEDEDVGVEATPENVSSWTRRVKVVVSGGSDSDEERLILAALRAINSNAFVTVDARLAAPDAIGAGDWLIWLSPAPVPQTSITHIVRVVLPGLEEPDGADRDARDTPAATTVRLSTPPAQLNTPREPLITSSAPGSTIWNLRSDLTLTDALEGHLTLQLASLLLQDARSELDRYATRFDHRVMPETERFSLSSNRRSDNKPFSSEKRSMAGLLAVLLIVLTGAERMLANRRQQ